MPAQPYTKDDLEMGEEIVKALHGIRGFEAWAEYIAKALAAERERCAKIALSHVCTFGSMAEELHSTATAKAIAAEIRRNEK